MGANGGTLETAVAVAGGVDELAAARRDRLVPAVLAGVTALGYSLLAVRLHRLFRTGGYDLGIFTQYARAFAHGQAPTSPLLAKGAALSQSGPDLLGDHFSPVLAALAPVYRLWPHAEALLLVQAALVAWSVYVVTACAVRNLGRTSGLYIGAAYALSWGVQQMVGFDFHEVAFELPLLACALAAYLDSRWRAAALWALPLLLVKEDMGPTVFVLGLLLARRDRRVGAVLCAVAAATAALAAFVVIPHFAGSLGRLSAGTDAGSGYGAAVKQPWMIPVRLVWPPEKLATVFLMLAVVAFVAAASPLMLLTLPTFLWRFTANTENYWGLSWHYSAVLMPIGFLALVDVLRREPSQRLPRMLRSARVRARIPAFTLVFAVALCPGFAVRNLLTPGFWQVSKHVAAENAAVGTVPSGVLVAATNNLAPHLVDRATVYPLVTLPDLDNLPHRVDWVVADTTLPDLKAVDGQRLLAQLAADGFAPVGTDDGIVVLHRGG